MTRPLSKAQAIRVRLGGSAAMQDRFPPKPKRMRWKTYRLLRAKAEGFWVESLNAGIARTTILSSDLLLSSTEHSPATQRRFTEAMLGERPRYGSAGDNSGQ